MTSKEWVDKICSKLESKGYHLTNINWWDDTETTWHNYCVYFRVKECKKWRFGFIFKYEEKTNDLQSATFFAKHIHGGSMKPSWSCYKEEITNIDKHSDSFFFEYTSVISVIDAIRYHPIIAYYREMCSDDFADRRSIFYRLIEAKKDELIQRTKDWYYHEYNFNHEHCKLRKIRRALLEYNDISRVELRDWNKLVEDARHYPRYELNVYLSKNETEGWGMLKCLYKLNGKQKWKGNYCHVHFFDEEEQLIFPRIDDELLEDIYGWRFRLRGWFKNVLHC